jgi:hypothetical protein
MTVSHTVAAALLMYAAATDNRQPSAEAAIGWANALNSHVSINDGKAAIDAHRATSTDWLMPAHVNAGVRAIRRRRTDAIGGMNPPPELDVADTIVWARSYVLAIGDGEEHQAAQKRACAAVGVEVPAQIEGTHRMPAVGHLVRPVS